MLSRIRNANAVGLEKVLVPYTKLNFEVVRILKDEGFIESFEILAADSLNVSRLKLISISLKFKKGVRQGPYISYIKRISRSGLRVYVNSTNIPTVWGGIGIAVCTG